ncbi:MAG TPA: ethanolamine ammonia-lyase subunit EutB [Gemmataceae bacterium]|jgi:ethanolamine ammonia-lyase large subunit|nr:ethanolamine ammonia-lyase subunit EutB [Gemmataceae bacterium]
MPFSSIVAGERFTFADLRELFAKANEAKAGDQLAGIAAETERERVAAKSVLADLPLADIHAQPLLDLDDDEVSRIILQTHDAAVFTSIRKFTVGEFREFLLDDATDEAALHRLRWAITPEMAAAVAKLMSNRDLVQAASKIRNVTRCRNTMGQRGVLGARIQPNHPSDDLAGILLSTLDGLLFGCGDAVIGVNPATESVEGVSAILNGLNRLIETLAIPTQACCLAHISTQLAALERGAPVDLLFQSVAGTETANTSFGVNAALLREGRERVQEHHLQRGTPHPNPPPQGGWEQEASPQEGREESIPSPLMGEGKGGGAAIQLMYFETGQGSALSAEAHYGIDQLTLEARAYGLARAFDPFLVNSVVGFIGPEYLYDERQIIRAGLEDHFMGKLLGLPMGCDVCYTNHAEADQNSADNLLLLLALAGCNYFMGVPCADDVMLNYQSTSYHDIAGVRKLLNLRPAPEFAEWLEQMGIFRNGEMPASDEPARKKLLGSMIHVLEARK